MFSFLSLFSRNRFAYRCPVTRTYHDPLHVRRALYLGSSGEFNEWLVAQRDKDVAVAFTTHEKLLPVVREAFGFAPLDTNTGRGVTDEEVIRAMSAYLRWLEGKG